MLDLGQLLPTAKRDSKLDTKSDRAVINEAAELKVQDPCHRLTSPGICFASTCRPLRTGSAS